MADKKADPKKAKVSQTDKYYKIKADFSYLRAYNYKITKEIGRGGYGVVYKVLIYSIHRRPTLPRTLAPNTLLKSTSTLSLVSSSMLKWRSFCWSRGDKTCPN